jgi:protein-S-isoprenylcysteine O-methyltransferase Ste14
LWFCRVFFAVRTRIEERELMRGLPGYADYAARVRYRSAARIVLRECDA